MDQCAPALRAFSPYITGALYVVYSGGTFLVSQTPTTRSVVMVDPLGCVCAGVAGMSAVHVEPTRASLSLPGRIDHIAAASNGSCSRRLLHADEEKGGTKRKEKEKRRNFCVEKKSKSCAIAIDY